MKLTIYNMKCEKITFPKPSDQLTEIATDLTCYLKENTSITHPSLVLYIKNGTDGAALYGANYCYIPKLGRYYFIDDIVIESDTILRYNCTVDVLNSFSDSILNQTVMTSRNENATHNIHYIDDRLPLKNITYITNSVKKQIFNSYDDSDGYGWFAITYFSTSDYRETDPEFFVSPYGANTETKIVKYNKKANDNLLDQIADLLVTNYSTFGTYICSMFLLPFTPTESDYLKAKYATIKIGDIVIGSKLVDESGESEEGFWSIADYHPYVEFYAGKNNTFLDLTPYTTYTVYLPLYGEVVLDPEKVAFDYPPIVITWNVDFTTGALAYKVIYGYRRTTGFDPYRGGVQTYSTTILNPIPLSSTNAQEIDRQKEAYTLSYTADILNSVGTMAGSLGNGGVAGAVGGALQGGLQLGASTLKYSANLKTLLVHGNVQQSSSEWLSYCQLFSDYSEYTSIILFKYYTQSVIPIDDADQNYIDYKHLNGVPYVTTCSLTDLTGYTEIADCHIDNIYSTVDNSLYATSEELDMIYEALTTGVIIETH